MSTATANATKQATNYQEAYDAFVAWHPKTLKRKGANGMTFDYLPVQNYEHFLDETVGPQNWQTDMAVGDKGVVVRLVVFGVMKASSSDVQASTVKGQSNETNKAEARAFRRAAAKHGMLRYLWEKDNDTEDDDDDEEDERPARKSKSSSKSSGSGSGSGKASPGQVAWLTKSVEQGGFGVPKAVASRLTAGRDGSASGLIDALKKAKEADEDEYEEDPDAAIRKALKKVAPKLMSYLDEEDDEDEDEDED